MSFSVPPIKQPPEGSSAQPVVQYLAQVMATYSQQLTEIVPGPPYRSDQIMRALQLIESTGAQMSTYANQLEQTVPGSTSQPEAAACFAYHQQTLQQAHNIYQAILRSLDLPQVVPPAGPNPLDDGPQERMRQLLEDM